MYIASLQTLVQHHYREDGRRRSDTNEKNRQDKSEEFTEMAVEKPNRDVLNAKFNGSLKSFSSGKHIKTESFTGRPGHCIPQFLSGHFLILILRRTTLIRSKIHNHAYLHHKSFEQAAKVQLPLLT
jgi:hypothetical protein